ncbi:PucR family transcriptional regulator, partial [Kitasatospora sp. NPDC059571]|uniref:PucR family transcriptional regulator n=1 Tax=Kitasatospora sp. NPDC059571 TaxID=3346871 RepID=UPI0036A8FBD2
VADVHARVVHRDGHGVHAALVDVAGPAAGAPGLEGPGGRDAAGRGRGGRPPAPPPPGAAPRPAGRLGAAALTAELDGGLAALLAVPAGPDPVRVLRDALRAAAPEGAVAALGPAVPADAGWERYGESLRDAATTLELAVTVPPAEPDRPGPGEPYVTTARALTLERELTRSGGRERWSRLAEDALGPLLDWEARHPSDLVRTLEVHLRHGCSPTRTAALLHIGRQSLYQRLERIERLLGVEVADPELQAELLLAACAFRLLRAGAGPAAGRRTGQRAGASAGTRRRAAYSSAVPTKPATQVRSPIPGAARTR